MSEQTPRCYGSETVDKKPACANEPVRDVAFRAPGSKEWHLTQWCDDCRAQARADGYTTYTWTDIIGHCSRSCGKHFRASVESIEASRGGAYGELTDIEVVEGWDFCLNCLEDGDIPGEHDIPAILTHTPFATGVQIAGLTPADIFAIAAALDLAWDGNAEERYPGIDAAQRKVATVVDQLRALGYEPPTGDEEVEEEDDSEPLFMRLAHAFAEVMHRETTDEQLGEIVRRNREETNPSVCHSHDFADANEWMAEAFARVMHRAVDVQSDEDSALWNDAWTHARLVDFYYMQDISTNKER